MHLRTAPPRFRLGAVAPRALILFAAATSGCASSAGVEGAGSASRPRLSAGDHEIAITHEGRGRSYVVHIPPRASGPLPVLLAFHGGGGNAYQFQRGAGLDAVADREGFIVVYPAGTGPLPARLLTWNAGDACCGYARNNNVGDVGFAGALVEDLARRTSIARDRIYATGHSNGAMMAHRLAAERPDLVAAVVAVAGALDLARFAPSLPVPVLHIHSVDDPRALYEGGLGPPFPGTDVRVRHQSVKSAIDRWVAHNGCSVLPDTTETRSGGTTGADAGVFATLITWRSCRGGAEVAHWKLIGAGHGWPGDTRPAGGEVLVGRQTNIISAAEEVWAFVSRFRR